MIKETKGFILIRQLHKQRPPACVWNIVVWPQGEPSLSCESKVGNSHLCLTKVIDTKYRGVYSFMNGGGGG